MLTLGVGGEEIAGIAIVGGIVCATIGMLGGFIRRIKRDRERETTKREVAAYVAEGSMTADDAKKILDAGRAPWEKLTGR